MVKATDPAHAPLLERFLFLLGVSKRQPSIEALAELVTRFVMRVPFENVSKLYYLNKYGSRSLPGAPPLAVG